MKRKLLIYTLLAAASATALTLLPKPFARSQPQKAQAAPQKATPAKRPPPSTGGLSDNPHALLRQMAALRIQAIRPIKVPPFSLPDVDSKTFNTQEAAGKVIIFNFWATW